ncbi:MAG: flagellar hook-associated protein FlgK, partial [Alphaproteobacteria bacterium]|nr:flagellar hook-associated protein FlgK [Alphaproteobacteria bacterium]
MVQTNLYVALNNALTGLSVNQTALATLSQNISNANTPGYSRQAVQLADNVVNGGGYGVKVEDVTRQVDLFLQRSSQQQNAVFSKSSVLNNYAQQIQALLGQPNGSSSTTSDSSIASAVTGFFNAVQQLAQSPTDGSMQLNMVSSAQNLASGVSGLAAGLQNLRYQADQQISQDVTTVNSTLVNLKQVNDAIGFASSTGNVSPDLLDQRDSMIKTLTQYLDINYYFDSSQQVHISASGGQPLLDGSISQLGYTPQSSVDNFTSNLPLQPITVQAMDANGQPIGKPTQLSTGGASSTITTSMTNGEIRGLMDMRDTQIPQLLDQLDMLASTVRDQVNAIQNSGSPYPGAASYTGQRSVSASDFSNWSGDVQIALLGPNGQPAISPYNGDTNGVPPLNLDLSSLDTGAGAGNPSVQGIINAINTYFTPKNRVSLGDINNIQLASDSPKLPSSPPQFSFDLNLENTTGKPANVFVTNVQVKDAAGTDITSYSSTAPVVNLASTGTYTTTAGSNLVTLTATGPISGVQDGDYVYLSQPPGPVNGIPANELGGGFFKVMNVSGNTFQIQTPTTPAASSGTDNESGITATPKYTTVGAGVNTRTNNNGIFTANLGANPNSSFYTITLDVTTQ